MPLAGLTLDLAVERLTVGIFEHYLGAGSLGRQAALDQAS
jgi:hypothetical protein